jgi:hypothetical protein
MNRRQFLTAATAITTIGVMHLATPRFAAAKTVIPTQRGTLYEGTKDGKLYESVDGGKTWTLLADFGPEYPVLLITPGANDLLAVTLGYTYLSFDIYTTDRTIWRTV